MAAPTKPSPPSWASALQTVQVHLRNIFGKLGVGSRSEAVARAIQYGWITLEVGDDIEGRVPGSARA